MHQIQKFLLFTTSDMRSERSEELSRLLASLDKIRQYGVKVELSLLLQRHRPELNTSNYCAFPQWIDIYAQEERMPLSCARNQMLNAAAEKGALNNSVIVAFPDDDCWYLPEAMKYIFRSFQQDEQLDFLFCRYASQPTPLIGNPRIYKPKLQEVVSRASSNTIFLRGDLVGKLGDFQEDLGVGTSLNGGEDTDYAIRAYLASRKTLFLNNAIIGHRDMDRKIRNKYFAGSFVAIKRNSKSNFQVKIALVRKLVAGVLFLISGQLDLVTFKRALKS